MGNWWREMKKKKFVGFEITQFLLYFPRFSWGEKILFNFDQVKNYLRKQPQRERDECMYIN